MDLRRVSQGTFLWGPVWGFSENTGILVHRSSIVPRVLCPHVRSLPANGIIGSTCSWRILDLIAAAQSRGGAKRGGSIST